jgi:hypothetical protein
MNAYGGRRFGPGWGYGRGFGWGARPMGPGVFAGPAPYAAPGFFAQPTSEQELAALKQQAQYLGDALEQVNARMAELEKEME